MSKWKGLTFGILAAAIALSPDTVSAAAEYSIQLNYKESSVSNRKIISDGTMFVPLQQLAQDMGYALTWNQSTKTAKLVRPDSEVTLTTGTVKSAVNGTPVTLAHPPRIIKGKTYVPLVSAVKAMGGKTVYDSYSASLNIVDELRYSVAASKGRTYWVSQANGNVYSATSGGKPVLIGELPFADLTYTHRLIVRTLGKSDLLLLTDNHYAMFNDFSNGYQALIQNGNILKQMEYHYMTPSYAKAPIPPSTRPYMTDGKNIQLINPEGNLGKALELESLTGASGDFVTEYAAEDIILVRLLQNTRLYAIDPVTGVSTDLTGSLISSGDLKEWERADGSDPYIAGKMLTLKKRDGGVLTFTYSPIPDGKEKTVTYNLAD
ncbi:hypothetical protein C2I18_25880 [Paenibacillus sp. PK3_47]|uniref:copper amine oxidase N-terminal domain-containing protein n=1 Tax=Paenibacillus sp. PK3_47 TaxID=2072642 RepID=UPI00201D7922|nr:copper amine oxidase N-terminal domain-containing protein [Paenibacillus sp. PK3_47]UQZ36663.1 hypothetical protein C2I18_25880 [Paenibacillus sp. PK3_47]